MEKTWLLKEEEVSSSESKIHPVVQKLLRRRGLTTPKSQEDFFYFDYDSQNIDPFLFSDMEKAVERIVRAKESGEKVVVFGDYDADGVTASVLLVETLRNLGFSGVLNYIPERQTEGYGMNEKALEYLKSEGASLVVTVDCGITNVSEVEKARELGMDVIITDHHHAPKVLPRALALINPQIEGCSYPSKNLAGVGVAFKLAEALYQKIAPEKVEQLKWSLDLVAIGTIADCVPLLGENRVLTRYGLIVLSKTKRVGLREMFAVGRMAISEDNLPSAHQVAFMIAPRINAAGRMDHANVAYNLLLEKNPVKARDLALQVEDQNQERQKVTGEIVREIRVIAENSFREKKFIFVSNPHWSLGLVGLVAGRIADEFKRPTVVLQKKEGEYAGSLRSDGKFNLVEALEECRDLLIRFGGHSQAAGLRVSEEKAEAFYQKFEEIVNREVEAGNRQVVIEIDEKINADEIDWDLVNGITQMEPFGEGNSAPVFLSEGMLLEEVRVVGNGSKHLKLSLRGHSKSPKIFEAIGFSMGDNFPNLAKNDKLDIVFNLEEDEWNGNKKIQLRIIDFKKHG